MIVGVDEECMKQVAIYGCGDKASLIRNAIDTERYKPDEVLRKLAEKV